MFMVDILHFRLLTLEQEENTRLKRQVEELKNVQRHSEIMSHRLKQVTKEKEELLIRYIYTMSAVLIEHFINA